MLQFVADTKKRNAITYCIFIVYMSHVVSIEHSQSYMRQIIRWDRLIPLYTQWAINTLRPSQNGRHFPDDIFKCIFLNENV